jgi:putative DNA primase/helicase
MTGSATEMIPVRNPVREYLESLKWDGAPTTTSVAEHFEDPTSARSTLNRFFLDAVRRAFEPGCQVDKTLVIVGPEGSGKSSFLKALGGEWYTAGAAGGAWIVEREFGASDQIKAYLDAREDTYRPAYGTRSVSRPRTFLPVLTSNTERFADTLIVRRFYVLRMSHPVEVILALRDQLWAEAVANYHGSRAMGVDPATHFA